MSACNDIDALMIDWLYEELDEVKSAEFDHHLAGCARCRSEVESLQQTRAAVREWPEVEPPSAVTAILLHEAAKHVPAKRRAVAIAARDDDKPGLWAWLVGMMAPVVRHPAAAALATLVLVAGVAGSLYLREVKIAQPLVKSESPPPVRAELAHTPAAAAAPDKSGRDFGKRSGELDPADSYAVQLADEGDIERLSRELAQDPFADSNRDQQVATKAPTPVRGNELADRKRKISKKPPATPQWDGTLANAVSGADELVDLEEANQPLADKTRDFSGGVLGGTSVASDDSRGAEQSKMGRAVNSPVTITSKASKKKDYASPPPPPAQGEATAQYRPYDAKRELKWAQTEERKLSDALRGQRCRDAARIANDILDRNPDYYYTKVERSKAIKSCAWYVKDERQKRSRRRSKARPKRAAPASPMEADAVE